MADIKMEPITLRYTGLFDFDGLYAAITDWGKNYGYIWHETTYKHKVPTPAGAEQEIKWVMEKNVTEYIKYKFEILVHTWDQKEVEVEINGQKRMMTTAKVELVIKGTLTYDRQEIFKGGKFTALLGKWYEWKLIKQVETVYWDQLHYRTWNLHALIKKYFDMQKGKYAYKGYLGES
ncbi:MAG: DUF515 domain-containing protein [Nanoarchaeota archaeon]|nr:DUF515 domain-containing protein [Nanoarchaeota archaeon]MBU1643861.1 DUF515 domain-containing protein [Nanoarchaeota archaeon]MBU1977453.1 DUF515 domain-containing protein [Nanoarchaeota archaeon]